MSWCLFLETSLELSKANEYPILTNIEEGDLGPGLEVGGQQAASAREFGAEALGLPGHHLNADLEERGETEGRNLSHPQPKPPSLSYPEPSASIRLRKQEQLAHASPGVGVNAGVRAEVST